mmetsp:Transcript_20549/g.29810  ORF Transcript_20549/g.29810 Transcript_20549/m.29810 type:complete len:485 (-) Transcript_20549:33-1487(-)
MKANHNSIPSTTSAPLHNPLYPLPYVINSLDTSASSTNPILCVPIASSSTPNETKNDGRTEKNNKNIASEVKNTKGGGSTRAKSRKNRVYALRSFLLKTYFSSSSTPPPLLDDKNPPSQQHQTPPLNPKTTTILDVAGGKGDLSWILLNADGMKQSIVVDPRTCTSHTHLLRSVQFLKENPKLCQERSVQGLDTFQPLATIMPQLLVRQQEWKMKRRRVMEEQQQTVDMRSDGSSYSNCADKKEEEDINLSFRTAKHLRVHFDDNMVSALRIETENMMNIKAENNNHTKKNENESTLNHNDAFSSSSSSWESYWSKALSRTDGATSEITNPSKVSSSINNNSNEVLLQDASIVRSILLHDVNLIVGFHPDQATEACIDLALLLRIPFAIVPCCVFPSEFPNRFYDCDEEEDEKKGDDDDVSSFSSSGKEEKTVKRRKKVKSYNDFIIYLKRKHEKIKMDYLDFFHETDTARRIVLYLLPEDFKE